MRRLTILVVAILACVGVQSAAATQWWVEHKDVPVGEAVEVHGHSNAGAMKLYFREAQPARQEILTCTASGDEVFSNTQTTGIDETRSFAVACTAACGEVTITPNLPWGSVLLEPAPFAMPDEWAGVSLQFSCGAADYGTFQGTLKPVSGDGDQQAGDEADSFLDFRSGQTLVSTTNPKNTLTFVGYYRFGTKPGTGIVTGEVGGQP